MTNQPQISRGTHSVFGEHGISERLENDGLLKNRESMGTIRSEVQSLREIMKKNPELAAKTLANMKTQIALIPNMPSSVSDRINESQKKYNKDSFQVSEQLVAELEGLLDPEEISESQIQEHTEKADAYLVNTLHPMDPKQSVLRTTTNPQQDNPFYGDLVAPARIQYKKEGEEKNYAAEYAQSALKGLPVYEKDIETPKMYTAVSPNGNETRIIYWIPNNLRIKDFNGHWAMKGQLPQDRAFIPDGWTIREIEKPEEKDKANQEIAQEKPKIQNEKQKIDTVMQNPETKKETAKILAARLTETLRKEMQSTEKSQQGMTEAFLIAFNAHFSASSKPAEIKKPETAEKAVPQITATLRGKTVQQESVSTESAIPEIQEQEGMRYITHLFAAIHETEQEKRPEKAEKEAIEAVITLEEIFESMEITVPQKETTPQEKMVSMDDLLGEQKTPLEEESVEIERRMTALKTKTLETLRSMRLTFDSEPKGNL